MMSWIMKAFRSEQAPSPASRASDSTMVEVPIVGDGILEDQKVSADLSKGRGVDNLARKNELPSPPPSRDTTCENNPDADHPSDEQRLSWEEIRDKTTTACCARYMKRSNSVSKRCKQCSIQICENWLISMANDAQDAPYSGSNADTPSSSRSTTVHSRKRSSADGDNQTETIPAKKRRVVVQDSRLPMLDTIEPTFCDLADREANLMTFTKTSSDFKFSRMTNMFTTAFYHPDEESEDRSKRGCKDKEGADSNLDAPGSFQSRGYGTRIYPRTDISETRSMFTESFYFPSYQAV